MRIPVKAGDHSLQLEDKFATSVNRITETKEFSVAKGEIKVWRQRTFPGLTAAEQQTMAGFAAQ